MSRIVQVMVNACCGLGSLPQVGKPRSNHNTLQWGKQDSNLRRQSHQIYSLAHLATLEFPRSPPHALTQSAQVGRKAGRFSHRSRWPARPAGRLAPCSNGCRQPTREIFGLVERKLHPREPLPLCTAPPVTTPPAVFEGPGVWIPKVAVEATTGSRPIPQRSHCHDLTQSFRPRRIRCTSHVPHPGGNDTQGGPNVRPLVGLACARVRARWSLLAVPITAEKGRSGTHEREPSSQNHSAQATVRAEPKSTVRGEHRLASALKPASDLAGDLTAAGLARAVEKCQTTELASPPQAAKPGRSTTRFGHRPGSDVADTMAS